MKAKDYFEYYFNGKSDEEITSNIPIVVDLFIKDAEELVELRKAKNASTVIPCIKEIDKKWKALCRLCESSNRKLDTKLFMDTLIMGILELYAYRVSLLKQLIELKVNDENEFKEKASAEIIKWKQNPKEYSFEHQ